MKQFSTAARVAFILALCFSIILCLFMMVSTEVQASPDKIHKEVKIVTDFKLKAHADIKKFLNSVRLVSPASSYVKMFDYQLFYINDADEPVQVFDDYAEPGFYIFQMYVELKDGDGQTSGTGGLFAPYDQIKSTLNGIPITMQSLYGPFEQKVALGWWRLDCRQLYKMTFDAAGGSPKPKTQIVEKGDLVKKPKDPVRSGYKFLGWDYRIAGQSMGIWNFDTAIDDNMHFVALWKALPTKPTTTTTKTTTTTTKPTTTTTKHTTTTTTTTTTTATTTLVPPETTITEPIPETTPTTINETLPDTTTMTTEEQTTTDLLIIGTETTPPLDRKMSGSKLPLYVGIAAGVVSLAAIATIVYALVQRKKEK